MITDHDRGLEIKKQFKGLGATGLKRSSILRPLFTPLQLRYVIWSRQYSYILAPLQVLVNHIPEQLSSFHFFRILDEFACLPQIKS